MTTAAQQLNQQFGIKGQLDFRDDPSSLIIADISNAHATASLCLQGAHLMSWQPRNQTVPVVWLSRDAKLAAGKSIRGGVPICWPWFGAYEPQASSSGSSLPGSNLPGSNLPGQNFPGHGYARTVPWRVLESGTEPNGATRLTLRLVESDQTRAQWPHASQLDLTVIVGETLRMELTTENTGNSDFVMGAALHTYFHIGDIGAVRVRGLEGCEYWDKVGGSTLKKQSGAITFAGETDRVYINTAATCVIEDDRLKRRIHVAKSGSLATVVWTPWVEKANKMGDMGQPDGWREMVCVESANALENTVTLAAGCRHTLIVQYHAESL